MNKMNLKQQPLKITHRPQPKRRYFDVGLGAICLAGADTGGAFCLLDVSLAPGIGVPRHTHTREDETYYVLSGELEVEVGDQSFLLRPIPCWRPEISRTSLKTPAQRRIVTCLFSRRQVLRISLMQRRSPLRKVLQLPLNHPGSRSKTSWNWRLAMESASDRSDSSSSMIVKL
jgi:hypothetical protein